MSRISVLVPAVIPLKDFAGLCMDIDKEVKGSGQIKGTAPEELMRLFLAGQSPYPIETGEASPFLEEQLTAAPLGRKVRKVAEPDIATPAEPLGETLSQLSIATDAILPIDIDRFAGVAIE